MADTIGNWRLKDFDPGAGLTAGATTGTGSDWIATDAPGDTYCALIEAGRLDHPYMARDEATAAWVRDREWWWHTAIDLEIPHAGEGAELLFEGLDTFADVYLDGTFLGHADNMFRTWRFDLAGITPGRHDLAVCFHPATAMVAGAPLKPWSSFADRISRSRRTLMRKAQFGWGWDWGPDLPTVGIWQPVRVERNQGATVRSVNATTLTTAEDSAQLRIDVELTAHAPVEIQLLDPKGAIVATATRENSGSLLVSVPNPQLWWSAGLGAQPLYTLIARVAGAPDFERRIGIRIIALDQSPDPDESGTHFFRFVLNGVPIFAKGANWIPASSFVGKIPDTTYRDLLERAAGANMNMIRVWGGGLYEPDIFYDECDRLGLLVWQDFLFACAPYPGDDPAFLANVDAEIAEQVTRLRHHACLALWCGNNENQALQWFDELAGAEARPLQGLNIYENLIPAALARLDPDTPYRPGSPWGGATPNSMSAGDVHNWTVWHGIPYVPDDQPLGAYSRGPEGVAFTRYAEDQARFVSEFGIQAAADIGTLRRWMAPEDLVLGSEGFLDRIKDEADKASAMMIPCTGLPTTFEQWVDFTMLTQAEGMKFGIEHYRRRMPHCSGALIWQHNDCWPCVSWSLIDYDGVAKTAWYATRRAFAPVLASFRRDGDMAELWITNDRPEPISDVATITLARLDGGAEWREQIAFDAPANSSVCVWQGSVIDAADHLLTIRSAADLFPANRLLLAAVKDLRLSADPGLTIAFAQADAALHVTITAERYALAIHLRSDDADWRYDDNAFDLAGGETRTVIVSHANGARIDPASLEISCWNGKIA